MRSRTRECDDPAPAHQGENCTGIDNDTENCNEDACPIDGMWGVWTPWGACPVSCGGGMRSRTRECDDPAPAHQGENCTGIDNDTENCNEDACPIDGMWGVWTPWGACPVSCGGGMRSRTRECDNPAPAHQGENCTGIDNDTENCNEDACPIDGMWGVWTPWGACPVSCGGGMRSRTRECDDPAPAHQGENCTGIDNDTENCNEDACPIDGMWGVWTPWGACPVSCGGGMRSRTRECDDPAPAHQGENCTGIDNDTENCNEDACPIDGMWGVWTPWGACPVSCGGGMRSRTRECDDPAPAHQGENCTGIDNDTENCNEDACPIDGMWGVWTPWGACPVSCGGGMRSRTRECDDPAPAHQGENCTGIDNDTENCNEDACPIDGMWGVWTPWGACPVSCGGGTRSRTRECDDPAPAHQGENCTGIDNDTENCNEDPCPSKLQELSPIAFHLQNSNKSIDSLPVTLMEKYLFPVFFFTLSTITGKPGETCLQA